LIDIINDLQNNIYDVSYGSGLYKIRVAGRSKGKSGGFRTLVTFKKDEMTIFIYGFGKGEKDNISSMEKTIFKRMSKEYLSFNDDELKQSVSNGELIIF